MNKFLLNEKQYVEEPFLRQLERLGWTIIRVRENVPYTGSMRNNVLVADSTATYSASRENESALNGLYDPSSTLREGFHEIVLERELRTALLRINPWLEEDQLPELVREITVPQKNSLIEANQEILEKLLESSSTENRKTGNRNETVRFIDFKNPEHNSFLAIAQFKVTIPGTEKHRPLAKNKIPILSF